ncbi:MAG: hydroxymethylpyrimidine/phosphomethylpyrimidine kinase [Marinifilaceae bacterium]
MHIKREILKDIKERPFVLSIAGFDPSSGAGITADIKTMEAHNVYGLGVISSISVQNDISFTENKWTDKILILSQIDILFSRYDIGIVKIGIIESLELLNDIVEHLISLNEEVLIVWDPIIRASAGYMIHKSINFELLENILKKIYLITPNLDEFSILFTDLQRDNDIISNEISNRNLCNILLKGGHDKGEYSYDYLLMPNKKFSNRVKRSKTGDKHGSGCILSASICSNMALGNSLEVTTCMAQAYISECIDYNIEALSIHNK